MKFNASIPDALRAAGLAALVLGVLLELDDGPWMEVLLIGAWGMVLIAILWRMALRRPIPPEVIARDLFTFGMVSLVVMRMLHLPGTWVALGVAMVGGLGVLWLDRSRIWPAAGEGTAQPWLFYAAMAAVLLGTLFRIQHWPYGTELLIGGLALCAVWFFWSMRAENNA